MRPNLHPARPVAAILLTLVIAIGTFLLRLPSISGRSLGGNEATTLLAIAGHAVPEYPDREVPVTELHDLLYRGVTSYGVIADELKHSDGHPPTYYWMLATWNRLFGTGLTTSRLLSNLLGAGFVAVFGLLFASSLSWLQLVLFELLIAFSSEVAFYATEARGYVLCLLLMALAVGALKKSQLAAAPHRWLAITGAIMAVGIFTNYMMILPAAAIGIWLLLENRKRSVKTLAISAGLYAIPCAIGGLASRSFYVAQKAVHASNCPGYKGFISDIKVYADDISRTLINSIDLWSFVITVAFLFTVAIALIHSASRGADRPLLRLALWLVAVGAGGLMTLNLVFDKYLYAYRYFIFATPGVWLAIGVAFGCDLKRPLKRALHILAVLTLVAELTYFNFAGRPLGRTDYSKSHFIAPVTKIYATDPQNTLVVIEHTPERDWHAGLIGELAKRGNLPVLVLPSGADGTRAISEIASRSSYQTIWYLLNSDQSPSAHRDFAERAVQIPLVGLQETFAWGFRLERLPVRP